MRTLTALLLFAVPAVATPPAVEAVFPPVGQRGQAFTVTLSGARLAGPQELLLYAPGLAVTKLEAKSESEVVAHLTASADCRLGEYPFRLRTAGGVSNLRTLHVTPLPVVSEAEPNDTPATAQRVGLGTTVAGTVQSADADHYRVAVKKGQRLTAEVQAVRLGGELLDPILAVFGPDGTEVAAADDTALFRQDPFVSLLAPVDGEYVIRVRDSAFGGGLAYHYALHVGSFPRPAGVFPYGGPAGQSVVVKFLGEPGGMTASLPKAGEPFALFPAADGAAAPTPQPFRVSPFPNVMEGEKPATAPVAFNGVVAKPNETDEFPLTAAAGETWQVEAFAARMGSPLDTVLTVLDPAGEVVARNDDDQGQDSRLTFTAAAAGVYRVRVADKRGKGGPLFGYRLEVTRPAPSLAVFLPPPARHTHDRETVVVPRGGRAVVLLGVRRDGCDGPAKLEAAGLPPGVTMTPATVPAGEYLVPVVLTASADAKGGALASVTGTCGGVAGGFSQTVDLVRGPGDSAFHAVTVDRLAVAVVEPNPVELTLARPAGPLPVDGAVELAVTVRRQGEAGPVEVSFPHLPPGVETGKPVVIPADQSTATIKLTCQPGAPLGTWPLFAEAKAVAPPRPARDPSAIGNNGLGVAQGRRPRSRGDASAPVQSALVPLTLAASPVAGKFLAAAAQPGKTTWVVVELESLPLTHSTFTATLDGLPPKVTAPAVQVAGMRIAFAVAADASVPPGDHPGLVCELTGTVNGQPVTYRVGRGAVLVIQPTGAAADNLSPLDRLRKAKSNGGSK